MKTKTHICLVSAQAAANLLPALDPALKPEKIVLVVSGKMEQQASHLQAVLKENGIAVEQFKLQDEHNYTNIENQLLELATGLGQDSVSLNITGGTKLMSAAAQAVASISDWHMFYVDVDTDRVTWLAPKGRPEQGLTEHLRLRHYLRSYGFQLPERGGIKRDQQTKEQQTLTNTLIEQIGRLEQPLSTLNWLAQQAEGKRELTVELDARQHDSRSLEELLQRFADAGALSTKGKNLTFSSEADRDFVKGGWLETHVMQVIHQLTGELGIRDSAANLEVTDSQEVKNELDVVFMARNRLFVIECKTARMDNPKVPKANDTLFKLSENCRRLGGLGARGLLVSYRALRESEIKLAKALNIKLACAADLKQLNTIIKKWIGPPRV